MKVAVTTAAADRRMATPADVVAVRSSLTTAAARARLDAVARTVESPAGLGWPPWRQTYALRLEGTDTTRLPLYAKPVETGAAITDLDATSIAFTLTGRRDVADRAERDGGWARRFTGVFGGSRTADPDSETEAFLATLTAGWLMPGQVSTWAAATAYQTEPATTSADDPATGTPYDVGAWVRANDPRVVLRFECTTAGTSDATEPAAFATAAAADTITDGTVTWTVRESFELPEDLSAAALELALHLDNRRTQDFSVKELRAPGGSTVVYRAAAPIPDEILDVFRRYR